MLTLIFAERYKLLRSKLLGFLLLGVAGQITLQILVSSVAIHRGTSGPPALAENLIVFMMFMLSLWIAAFIAFFIASEFQSGTIRNAIALGKSRVSIYISRLASATIAATAILGVYQAVSAIGTGLAFGFPNDWFMKLITDTIMNLPYYFTIASVFTLFAFAFKSPGATVLTGFGYMIAAMALMNFLGSIPELRFTTEFFPQYYIAGYQKLSNDLSFVINGYIVSAAFYVIPCVIGCTVFKKADIK